MIRPQDGNGSSSPAASRTPAGRNCSGRNRCYSNLMSGPSCSSAKLAEFTREGAPNCCCEKILYFEDLPDGIFDYQPPSGASFTNMPLTVPEASLSSLSDPGVRDFRAGDEPRTSLSKDSEQLWSARITNDWRAIRQLLPLSAAWPDGLLRDVGIRMK